MKHLLFIVSFLWINSLFAQGTLEAQFSKAGNKQEQIQIAIQIAQQNKDTDSKKAVAYAQKGYDLANSLGNQGALVQCALLGAEAFMALRQFPNAKAKFERSARHAEANGDFITASECYRQLISLAQRENDYKEAARYGLFAADLLKKKGGGGANVKSTTPTQSGGGIDNARWQSLVRENESLQKELNNLRQNSSSNNHLEQKLGGEQAKFADVKRQLDKQRLDSDSQIATLESDVKNMSEKQAKDLLVANKRKAENERLKKDQELASVKQEQELALRDVQLNKTRNILGGISLGVLALAGIFYTRYRQKKKSTKELEAKNKTIEEERKRSDELLLNILPADIANELKKDGKAQARQYKDATVLFTDFKDFTKISERLSPEQLVQELDYCFKAFDFIIGQYNIEKIKTIGDAYMCASGVTPTSGSTAKVVRAALEIQEFLEDYKQDRIERGLPYFEARMGIHTGPVVAGVVGNKKFAYDIWGDTVNVAARMEQNCEAGKINISESTYLVVKYDFNCKYRGRLPAKNKGEIEMYYVLGKS